MPFDITNDSISTYLAELPSERREDVAWLVSQMESITKRKPKLWGSIVGFGKLYYRYPTGNDGYMPIIAFASRKQALTLYLSFTLDNYPERQQLGKHTAGKSCLYIKRLSDVNKVVLIKMMKKAYQETLGYSIIKVVE